MNTNDEFEAVKNLVKDLTEQGVKVTVRISLDVAEVVPESHADYHPDHEQIVSKLEDEIAYFKGVLKEWGLEDARMSVTKELQITALLGGQR